MDIQSLLPYIGGAIVIILLLLIVTIGYVKAPPDTAYIISGLRKKIIVKGKYQDSVSGASG